MFEENNDQDVDSVVL